MKNWLSSSSVTGCRISQKKTIIFFQGFISHMETSAWKIRMQIVSLNIPKKFLSKMTQVFRKKNSKDEIIIKIAFIFSIFFLGIFPALIKNFPNGFLM